MTREIICRQCGHSNETTKEQCYICSAVVEQNRHDFQDVVFVGSNEGHHSWYSQPTAYHHIYQCKNFRVKCKECIWHGGTFCINGKIDIRFARTTEDGEDFRYEGSRQGQFFDDDTLQGG